MPDLTVEALDITVGDTLAGDADSEESLPSGELDIF
jgi:hypothetical protein